MTMSIMGIVLDVWILFHEALTVDVIIKKDAPLTKVDSRSPPHRNISDIVQAPVTGPHSCGWCWGRELFQPGVYVSPALYQESLAQVPPWPWPPSDSGRDKKITQWLQNISAAHLWPKQCFVVALTLSISFLEAEIFGFLWMRKMTWCNCWSSLVD